MKRAIYLDNSATTAIREEALNKYVDVSRELFGNPSSLHSLGYEAERTVTKAREIILESVGGEKCNLIFTSSGSEANNLAIIGRATAKERYRKGMKIITTDGEHASVREPIEQLKRLGHRVVYIKTAGGVLDFDTLERELDDDVILVSVMMASNETGAVYDLPRVSRLIKANARNAVFHVDATQGYLKLQFTMNSIGADMLTVSAHKVEGPKGIGALVVCEQLLKEKGLCPIIFGGGQELGLRSGTENVPAIAAFGEAVKMNIMEQGGNIQLMSSLRSLLLNRLKQDELCEIRPTLPPRYVPHILNITLPDIKSETMLHFLSQSGIYVSSGSACSSNSSGRASAALLAYGHTQKDADCSIRISFSRHNTPDDVDALCNALKDGLARLARIK